MAEKLSGALIVDKPRGPTSHDVVARIRKALHERRVGHAGTLDPMATGVLVVLVGEGTKLAPYLTAADKRYTARVTFGAATSTLDAEGEIVARAETPPEIASEIESLARDPAAPAVRVARALEAELTRAEQIPPAYSAIQIDGERSHDLARAGKVVELPPRAISVRSIQIIRADSSDVRAPAIEVDLLVSKGYYVRSFARDLGAHLGVPAHLSQLRRTASGAFTAAESVALDAPPEALRGAILPIATAVRRALPTAILSLPGAIRARQGKRLGPSDFEVCPPRDGTAAWLDPSEDLVAIGEAQADAFVVLRGFTGP